MHTVPHYLRTKLDLDLEARQQELEEEVKGKGDSLKEDIKNFNKMIESALDRVNEAREELDEQRAKAGLSCDLVTVVLCQTKPRHEGKGLAMRLKWQNDPLTLKLFLMHYRGHPVEYICRN